MEAASRRKIQDGKEYNHLFPSAVKNNTTVRKNSNVYHTVAFIPKVVHETLWQTKEIAKHLKGNTTYETCKNIWHFVYGHIAYKKDADGYEQIRSPARAWHDRYKGVDCDCYSVFISSILSNMKIPHTLRITKYHRDYFQHIYPIVPIKNGYIIIDCVTDQFDYEVPFSEKKDYPMDLQYLNGFEDEFAGLEEENISGMNEAGDDLGKLMMNNLSERLNNEYSLNGKKKKKSLPESTGPEGDYSTPKPKKKKFFGKLLHAVNKFNPATILLRKGILVAMKLNIKNAAKRLRWSYLTPAQAKQRNTNPVEFKKLLKARMKLEKIFYGTGGKLENLKKAILTGKGNRDKAVNGIEGLGMIEIDSNIDYMDENTPISTLLGLEMYQSEIEGLGQLGEPITLSAIAAASGVIAGIIGMLKEVKQLFPGNSEEKEDFDPEKNAAAENQPLPAVTDKGNNDLPASNMAARSGADNTNDKGAGDEEKPPGFWDKNKSWLKPVAIGAGVLTVVGIGYAVLKSKKPATPSRSSRGGSLNGAPRHKQRRKNHRRKTNHHHKKKAVALL